MESAISAKTPTVASIATADINGKKISSRSFIKTRQLIFMSSNVCPIVLNIVRDYSARRGVSVESDGGRTLTADARSGTIQPHSRAGGAHEPEDLPDITG